VLPTRGVAGAAEARPPPDAGPRADTEYASDARSLDSYPQSDGRHSTPGSAARWRHSARGGGSTPEPRVRGWAELEEHEESAQHSNGHSESERGSLPQDSHHARQPPPGSLPQDSHHDGFRPSTSVPAGGDGGGGGMRHGVGYAGRGGGERYDEMRAQGLDESRSRAALDDHGGSTQAALDEASSAGVGISFEANARGEMVVVALRKGGAAALSRKVFVGDKIVAGARTPVCCRVFVLAGLASVALRAAVCVCALACVRESSNRRQADTK
jgi:hypothetical protein